MFITLVQEFKPNIVTTMKISKFLFSFLFGICLFLQSNLIAQNNVLFEKATELVAQTQYAEAIQIVKQFLDTNTIEPIQNRIDAYNLLGGFYSPTKFNKTDSSFHYFKKSLALAKQHTNNEAIAKNAQDLGILYFRLQEYNKAIPLLKHSIQIYTDFQDHKNAARGISLLSYVYLKKRNYHKALLYQQQSVKTLEKYLPKDHYFITDAKHNLGAIHSKLQNHREAIDYILATYKIYKKSADKERIARIALDLGFLYQTFNKHDSALYYAQVILDQCSPEDHYNLTWVYSIKHEVAAKEKDFDHALKYGNIALTHALEEFGSRSPEVAYSYFYISNVYKEQKQWNIALKYIQKALIANHQTFADSSLAKNPLLTGAFSTEYQLLFLEYKAECLHLLYKKDQNKDALKESEHVFMTAIAMIDSLRQEYQVPQNLLIHNSINSAIYGKAISHLFDNYQLTLAQENLAQAYTYIEQNRAFVLNRILLKQEQLSSNQDSSILIGNYHLQKNTIEELEEQINALVIASTTDSTQLDKLQSKLVRIQQKQEQTTKELQKNQPAYYKQLFHTQPVQLKEIQKQLKPHEALIAYSVQEKEISILKIKKETIGFYQTTSTDSLSQLVVQFRDAILKKDDQEYLQLGYLLYQHLIEPLELEQETTQLYILPDNFLNYLPFDALLTQKQVVEQGKFPNYVELPYLLKKVKISYTFSATTWFQQCQLAASPNNQLVAFAPSFDNAPLALQRSPTSQLDYKLGNLKGSKQEVEDIKDLFPSTLKIGKEATKTAFLEHISKAKIIHLATHGLLNEENGAYSSIAFAPDSSNNNLLYAFELYGLEMNADLVVLSACNTALGKWKAGEGVMSLARGFTSTGCKSIVMSLWAVADQSAPTILPDFYRYLAKGEDKSTALQQAKLNYLKSADANGAHPYYWASLTLTGDISPLATTSNNNFSDKLKLLILGGIVILLLLIVVLKKRFTTV